MLLKDKTAVVTGGAQGIGQAFATGYANEGARIVIADISDGTAAVDSIKAVGGEAFYVKTDVTDFESCMSMAKAVSNRYGNLDIVLNNAAMYANIVKKPFTQISTEEWNRVMEVNTIGPFNCIKAAFPYMKEQGGKIINVSSSSIFEGPTGMPHYVASKGAVFSFTRSIARELGEYNICVNSLAPGYTQSEGSKKIEANRATHGPSPEEVSIQKRCLKRSATPEDMVGTVVFLSSYLSDFITGQLILCDGGASYN